MFPNVATNVIYDSVENQHTARTIKRKIKLVDILLNNSTIGYKHKGLCNFVGWIFNNSVAL